jgi:hypothetical protein
MTLNSLISFGSHNIKVFCKPCEKFKWLAEKNVVREGGLWLFKYGRQKVNSEDFLCRVNIFLLLEELPPEKYSITYNKSENM